MHQDLVCPNIQKIEGKPVLWFFTRKGSAVSPKNQEQNVWYNNLN